jgi:hypothetical protein
VTLEQAGYFLELQIESKEKLQIRDVSVAKNAHDSRNSALSRIVIRQKTAYGSGVNFKVRPVPGNEHRNQYPQGFLALTQAFVFCVAKSN